MALAGWVAVASYFQASGAVGTRVFRHAAEAVLSVADALDGPLASAARGVASAAQDFAAVALLTRGLGAALARSFAHALDGLLAFVAHLAAASAESFAALGLVAVVLDTAGAVLASAEPRDGQLVRLTALHAAPVQRLALGAVWALVLEAANAISDTKIFFCNFVIFAVPVASPSRKGAAFTLRAFLFHAAGAVSGEAKTRVLELVSLAGRVAVASHEGAVDRIPTPGLDAADAAALAAVVERNEAREAAVGAVAVDVVAGHRLHADWGLSSSSFGGGNILDIAGTQGEKEDPRSLRRNGNALLLHLGVSGKPRSE